MHRQVRLTLSRVAGLIAGFDGVVVLVGRGLGNGAGILILDEPIDWRLLAGTALIVAGIVIVNARALRAALPGRPAAAPHHT